jgi:hypothetical protein
MTKLKQPLAIRVLTWFAALISVGMYLSIVLVILDIGPHFMGGERVARSEWLHIAAPIITRSGGARLSTLQFLVAHLLDIPISNQTSSHIFAN